MTMLSANTVPVPQNNNTINKNWIIEFLKDMNQSPFVKNE